MAATKIDTFCLLTASNFLIIGQDFWQCKRSKLQFTTTAQTKMKKSAIEVLEGQWPEETLNDQ